METTAKPRAAQIEALREEFKRLGIRKVKIGGFDIDGILRGAMRHKTMYVVPYVLGPIASPFAKVGIELTDSLYVVLNMRIMTRILSPGIYPHVAWVV